MKKLLITVFGVVLLALGVVAFVERGNLYPVQAQETQTQDTQAQDTGGQETGGQDTGGAQAQPVDQLDEIQANLDYEENTIQVVETYGPSVVAVNVAVQGERMNPFEDPQFFDQLPEDFQDQIPEEFRRFFTPQEPQEEGDQAPDQAPRQQGSGSGFVADEAGDILTNYHVIRAALEEGSVTLREGAEVTVVFPGSDEAFPVTVVGANALYDLALLRLENPDELPEEVQQVTPIPVANSDEIRVGQKVIAIGNPFGFSSTVTTGIVSGVGRSLPGVGEANIPLVQTDAAINPGNSGGPLLNSRGELIGINTAIIPSLSATGQRGNLGIGFAVPANLVAQNLADLEAGDFTNLDSRPRLGISIRSVEAYPEAVRESLNLPDEGVAVGEVAPGSAAEEAGLRGSEMSIDFQGQSIPAPGDIILAADGTEVSEPGQLQDIVLAKDEGDTVELRVWRDGEELTLPVTLATVPAQAQQEQAESAPEEAPGGVRLGVGIQDLSSYPEGIRSSLNLPKQGVVVTEVAPNSPAAEAGLRGGQFTMQAEGESYAAGGDVILSIDGTDVTSAQEMQQLIAEKSAGDTVELRIWRGGEEQTLSATLAEAESSENN